MSAGTKQWWDLFFGIAIVLSLGKCDVEEWYFDRENVLHKTPFDGTNPNVDGHEESVTLWGFALQARVDEKPMVD